MTPVLLLDVMDTLVYDPYREMLPFFGCSWEELAKSRDPDLWPAFERGEIDEQTFLANFFLDQRSFDHEAFLSIFVDGYRWLPGIEGLLSELWTAGVEMHVLSNYPLWYRRIEEKLRLSQYLPWTFVSCKTGLRKPKPETYRRAAETLGRNPKECLFVDDREANCEGARLVGMHSLRFADSASLRAHLQAEGLL